MTAVTLTLFCYAVDVRYGGCFPRAHRKPQPSLARGLLRLTLRAFPQESSPSLPSTSVLSNFYLSQQLA